MKRIPKLTTKQLAGLYLMIQRDSYEAGLKFREIICASTSFEVWVEIEHQAEILTANGVAGSLNIRFSQN